MIVDTSALIAVALNEPEGPAMAAAISAASRSRMSAANWLEAAMVLEGRVGLVLAGDLDEFMRDLEIEIAPVTVAIAMEARTAFRRFGRGRHPAKLNFGDCFAYALAATAGEPLLFKGNDFSQTDITSALP